MSSFNCHPLSFLPLLPLNFFKMLPRFGLTFHLSLSFPPMAVWLCCHHNSYNGYSWDKITNNFLGKIQRPSPSLISLTCLATPDTAVCSLLLTISFFLVFLMPNFSYFSSSFLPVAFLGTSSSSACLLHVRVPQGFDPAWSNYLFTLWALSLDNFIHATFDFLWAGESQT